MPSSSISETVTYDGDDLAEYVIDCNTTRCNMTTGARAMSTALVLAADGRRENGRWTRGSVLADPQVSGWASQVARAGVVIDYASDLAPAVTAGDMALDAAIPPAEHSRTLADLKRHVRELSDRRRAGRGAVSAVGSTLK